MLFTAKGAADVDQRRDPLRRDDPPAGLRRPHARAGARRSRASSPASRSTRARRRSRSRPSELVTDGLDGLRARLVEYRELGARFAKWRAVIDIGDGIPTPVLHRRERARARALRRAVPGRRHRPDRRARSVDGRRATRSSSARRSRRDTLHTVFDELIAQRVELDGMLLKPNMVIPGKKHSGGPGDARRRSPRRRSRASARSCPRRCPASCSCRAVRATRRRPPTSTRSTSSARTRGRCRSRTAARCRPRR